MLRTLAHYWRVNLAVVIGAAVATAVLAGALIVGDSVRGSLRDLTLDRLGEIDWALAAGSFFREDLVDDLVAHPEFGDAFSKAVPAIVLKGSAAHPDSGSRASSIAIQGIDERFPTLFGPDVRLDLSRKPGQIFPPVVVNESLRRELGAEVGDAVLLSFGRWSSVPRETLLGDKDPEAVLGSARLTVTAVIPDPGLGRFGLTPRQQTPLNAFVRLEELQRSLGLRGQVNAILVAGRGASDADPNGVLRRAVVLEDLGLLVHRGEDYFAVESREFVLRPAIDQTIGEVAEDLGAPFLRTQSYLANSLQAGERGTPYSLVAALDPQPGVPWASLPLVDGSPAGVPTGDGILLNTWVAEDLNLSVGDAVEATYFVVGPREELHERQTSFRVEGIVAMNGLAADPELTPDYPGMQEAEDISAWDPPFPVDLDRIRTKDELYWDRYRATPKGFVSEATGRKLWGTRFGTTTAVRIGAPSGIALEQAEQQFRAALLERLSPAAFGLQFRAVKDEGLRAAAGATDFAGLFVSFSFFLILSAALLVGLLFRLGVEQRAGEIGLLLAVGHRVSVVRRRLLAEGGLLAAIGGLAGLAGGVGYAWLMMAGLRTVWLPAVGSSELYLHLTTTSLAVSWVSALLVVLFSVFFAVRRLVRVPPPRLLAGSLTRTGKPRAGRLNLVLAYGGIVGAGVLLGVAVASGALESPGLAFGTGSLLLISGLAFFNRWCRGSRKRPIARSGGAIAGMAARNSSWSPGRSILCVALVGAASFMIVVVEVFRLDPDRALTAKESASGGFALVAQSDVPLHQDLNRSAGRFELGFPDTTAAEFEGVTIFPLRLQPGDDASCLNLYQPEKPTVLGLPKQLIQRGGFTFQQLLDPPAAGQDPWTLLEQPLEDGVVPAFADWNSATWILHKKLGDEVVLDGESGEPVRLRLIGLLANSIFRSEVLISEENLLRHFPSRTGDAYFLVDAPAERADDVSRLLERVLAPFGFDATTARQKLADFEAVQNTYLSTFQLLGGLGLLLGTVGLGVVLVRNVIERRGELATLRAFGFRRSRLAWMVLAENAFLLVIGISVGTVAALAAVAPRLATREVPWPSLAATLVLVLLVGMLSSVAAVLGTLRVPLLPALKAEH